jgi:hypothetical protein
MPTGIVGCAEQTDIKSLFFNSCSKSSVMGCVWWYTLRVDLHLEKEIMNELNRFASWKRRFGREHLPVVAVHIRVGDITSGFDGKTLDSSDTQQVEALADKAFACSMHAGEEMGLHNATLLVISDSLIVKGRCKDSHSAKTWSSRTVPAHIEKSSAVHRHVGSLVDVFLLSLCDAIVKSDSSFSHLGAAIGMYPPERVKSLQSCGLNTRYGGM